MSLTLRCVVQRHFTARSVSRWRHRATLCVRTGAMATQSDTASTFRKLHELKIDQSFVRELPGDPSTENSLRQVRVGATLFAPSSCRREYRAGGDWALASNIASRTSAAAAR